MLLPVEFVQAVNLLSTGFASVLYLFISYSVARDRKPGWLVLFLPLAAAEGFYAYLNYRLFYGLIDYSGEEYAFALVVARQITWLTHFLPAVIFAWGTREEYRKQRKVMNFLRTGEDDA